MKNPKIVFLDASTVGEVNALEKIKFLGEYTEYDITKTNQVAERIADAQIVITNKVMINKEVLDVCSTLKLICISATGMNNVDLEYAAQKGVLVKNVAGYSTESVAQVAFSLILNLLNKISYFDNYVKSGEYADSPIFTNHQRTFWELKGKRFGIIGLGSIGKRVAEIASVFGAEPVYYSTSGKNKNKVYKHLDLNELLSTSDIVSVHSPLNNQTENLIGIRELKLMKRSAYLINTGRGGIVNEKDLAQALNESLIAGAGIDVLTAEPIAKNNPLLSVRDSEKVIITPHIAWISQEAREELMLGVYNNILDWQNA